MNQLDTYRLLYIHNYERGLPKHGTPMLFYT